MVTSTTSPSTPVTQGVPPPGAIARVTIGDFLRRSAARDPHKTMFVLGKQRMSYGEFNDQVTRCANALLAQGRHARRSCGDAVQQLA